MKEIISKIKNLATKITITGLIMPCIYALSPELTLDGVFSFAADDIRVMQKIIESDTENEVAEHSISKIEFLSEYLVKATLSPLEPLSAETAVEKEKCLLFNFQHQNVERVNCK